MSVFTPVRMDIATQIAPYFWYQRFKAVAGQNRLPFAFKIDEGYTYFLRVAVLTWPSQVTLLAGPLLAPGLNIEFMDRARNKPRQVVPIPISLISSPAGFNTAAFAAPAPVDLTAFGVNYTASIAPSQKILNFYYPFADVIEGWISGFGTVGRTWLPEYADIKIEGYNVPEKTLELWRGRGESWHNR